MRKIEFNEEKHEYTLNDKKFISGTQFLEKFHEHFDLDGCAEAYAIKNLIPKSSVIKLWDVNRELGTDLHKYMELQFIDRKNGKDFSVDRDKIIELSKKHDISEKEVELRILAGINALKQCEREGLDYHTPEIMIYITIDEIAGYFNIKDEHLNKEFGGIAGTADLLLEKNNIKHIFDWKYTKSIDNMRWKDEEGYIKTFNRPINNLVDNKLNKYSLQLNLYKWIMTKFYGYEFDDDVYIEKYDTYYRNHRLINISSASNLYEFVDIKVFDNEIELMIKWFFIKDEFKEEYFL